MGLFSPQILHRRYHQVTIDDDGERCLLDFGDCRVSLKGPVLGDPPRPAKDFVLLMAAAVGLNRGRRFVIDAPVTRDAVIRLEKFLFVWSCWRKRGVRRTDIIAENIVPPDGVTRDGGVFTLSGGVDSTFGVVEARRTLGLDNAILVAGADYPSAEHPGFRELHDRVKRTTDHLGIRLHVVETDVRSVVTDWVNHHVAVLTSILKRSGAGLGWAGYAADVTLWGELTYAPGSNMKGFAETIGTPDFPFHYIGEHHSRAMKLAALAERAPEVLKNISVCWIDTSTGGNCGKCSKCLRTRLAAYAAGLDQTAIFDDEIDLARAFDGFKTPFGRLDGLQEVRLDFYSLEDMPDGEVKDAVLRRMRRISRRHGLHVGSGFT